LLLEPRTGAFARFAADHLPSLAAVLEATKVDVLTDASGSPLPDISSAEEGMRAADLVLEIVRETTSEPDAAVIASIAGGRKTMGFLLGYALSLFGRPQDRLTHVLVDPPFQDHPDFFFPPAQPKVLFSTYGHRPARTDEARVVLTDIPFVRLRAGLPKRLLEGRASFAETIGEAQAALRPPRLVVDVPRRRLVCGEREVAMPPAEFAFVLWLARRRLSEGTKSGGLGWHEAEAGEYLAAYRATPGSSSQLLARIQRGLRDGVERPWFEQRVTNVNKLLKDALGQLAAPYCITRIGRRPRSRYCLAPSVADFAVLDGHGE